MQCELTAKTSSWRDTIFRIFHRTKKLLQNCCFSFFNTKISLTNEVNLHWLIALNLVAFGLERRIIAVSGDSIGWAVERAGMRSAEGCGKSEEPSQL